MEDYYLALGLGRDADAETIKKAYREYCKKYHPDSCERDGSVTPKEFLVIREAYDTLSDREKKKEYDRSLESMKPRGSRGGVKPKYQSRSGRRYGHPLYREGASGAFRNFGRTAEGNGLHAELVLSRHEAAVGGTYKIEVPLAVRCRYCSRFGIFPPGFCPVCGGSGLIRREETVLLEVPAGIADGTRNTVRLATEGSDGVFLMIDVAVE